MLEELRKIVCEANLELVKKGLVIYTWGNVSGIDREKGLIVIKPSGVKYEDLTPDKLVIVDLDGNKVEGDLNPSSDTLTHLEIYKAFKEIGGIVHTHSTYAVAWAQAKSEINCYGTTHADYFYGPIPCTRELNKEELKEYEKNTGKLIVETFNTKNISPVSTPAILCANHGPFSFGKDPNEAVYNAVVLEEISKMALLTKVVNPFIAPVSKDLINKHYYRKHGDNAYYGQK